MVWREREVAVRALGLQRGVSSVTVTDLGRERKEAVGGGGEDDGVDKLGMVADFSVKLRRRCRLCWGMSES